MQEEKRDPRYSMCIIAPRRSVFGHRGRILAKKFVNGMTVSVKLCMRIHVFGKLGKTKKQEKRNT